MSIHTPATGRPALGKIGQVSLTVQDVTRAAAFYRDTLGVPFLFQVPGMAFFQCGEVRVMLTEKSDESSPASNSILYYKVEDIQAVHASLEDKGVKVERAPAVIAPMPDHDLWMSFYRDSEEILFAVMCEIPRS